MNRKDETVKAVAATNPNLTSRQHKRIADALIAREPETWEAAHYALGAAAQRLHVACATADVETITSAYAVVGELLEELAKASRPH